MQLWGVVESLVTLPARSSAVRDAILVTLQVPCCAFIMRPGHVWCWSSSALPLHICPCHVLVLLLTTHTVNRHRRSCHDRRFCHVFVGDPRSASPMPPRGKHMA